MLATVPPPFGAQCLLLGRGGTPSSPALRSYLRQLEVPARQGIVHILDLFLALMDHAFATVYPNYTPLEADSHTLMEVVTTQPPSPHTHTHTRRVSPTARQGPPPHRHRRVPVQHRLAMNRFPEVTVLAPPRPVVLSELYGVRFIQKVNNPNTPNTKKPLHPPPG